MSLLALEGLGAKTGAAGQRGGRHARNGPPHRACVPSGRRAEAVRFRLEESPFRSPGAGEILLRTIWLSLDPYMRGRMSDAPSYASRSTSAR